MPPTAMTTCFSPLLSPVAADPRAATTLPLAVPLAANASSLSCLPMYSDEISRRIGLVCLDRAMGPAEEVRGCGFAGVDEI